MIIFLFLTLKQKIKNYSIKMIENREEAKNRREREKKLLICKKQFRMDDCIICFEKFDKKQLQKCKNCNQMFHNTCINEWLSKSENKDCPHCRENII